MRIAIFGDIHGNLEALEAVLEDANSEGCSMYASTGDIVGIGASPHEFVEIVRGLKCPVVKGDFDEQAYSDGSLDDLNPVANSAMLWTRSQVTQEDKIWLRELPMTRQVEDFTLAHATLDSPGSWAFALNEFDAMASISHQTSPLCFIGHTHSPRIYIKADLVEANTRQEIPIDDGKQYLINVGSVGQPRDGDPRACYVVYDLESSTVKIKPVDYDFGSAQQKIIDSGLPPTRPLKQGGIG